MSASITAEDAAIHETAQIADSVVIEAEQLTIGPGVVIEGDVTIRAREVTIGHKTVIETRSQFGAIGGLADLVRIGDYSRVGHDGTLLLPALLLGDYNAIHNHVLVNGYKTCQLGHNCFVGQHSVLNASEELTIGNNFRMALNGYVWTHAESGELLEGCTFYHRTPTVIEDNVWLAGCNISISPGVRLADGTIVLMHSVVTEDTLPRHCYGGAPARDLTEKLQPYRSVSEREKADMMRGFVEEFKALHPGRFDDGFCFASDPSSAPQGWHGVVVIEDGAPVDAGPDASVFSLSDKTYIKRRSELEELFMRFLVGARARFLPLS